jgi:hypothetical protein
MRARITVQFLLMLVAQLLDYRTTLIGLKLGAEEQNPAVRYILDNHGTSGLLWVKVGSAIAITALLRRRPTVLAFVTLLFAGVALANLSVIERLLAA